MLIGFVSGGVVMEWNGLRLVEPMPVEDDLCSGLALIEDLDMGARFVLYARQTLYETGDTMNVVKRKIVLPTSAIGPGLEMAGRYLAKRAVRIPGAALLRLVR